MESELFFTDDGRTFEFNASSFNLEETFTSEPDDIDPFGTQFFIYILEDGWVENVHLVTDGHFIPAIYQFRGHFEKDPEHYYSIFSSNYHYHCPCKKMEAHFTYRIGCKLYDTSSLFFEVKKS